MFSDEFIRNVEFCIKSKLDFDFLMSAICEYMTQVSPEDYSYYFKNTGSVCVDVPFEDINKYVSFFDELFDCKYTSVRNLNGIVLMVSLSTLKECIV